MARQALAAARAEAKRRGLAPGRVPAPDPRRDPGAAGADRARVRWRRPVTDERSGAHPDDRDPQLLGPTLDRLVADQGWETDAAVGGVMGRWAEIVGAEVAAHAEPVSWPTASWSCRPTRPRGPPRSGCWPRPCWPGWPPSSAPARSRSVVVHGPSAPSWKRGLRSVRGRGPRDTYG